MTGSEVEILYEPIKQVKIHDIHYFESMDKFISECVAMASLNHGVLPMVRWAEGMLFIISFYYDTDKMVWDSIEGITHWRSVFCCKKETFEKKIAIQGVEMQILDSSCDELFCKAAKYLKFGWSKE